MAVYKIKDELAMLKYEIWSEKMYSSRKQLSTARIATYWYITQKIWALIQYEKDVMCLLTCRSIGI